MIRHSTFIKHDGIAYGINHFFHILCALFSLFLIWGLSENLSDGVPLGTMPHIPVLLLLSLAGSVYRDTWYFNTQSNTITSVYGFAWICKRETFSFSDVEQLEITHFVRGSSDKEAKPTRRRLKAMLVFSLKLKDDQIRSIEIMPEKTSGGRTESAMQAIGAVTGLPLYMDRPRDLDLNVSYKDL
ncbi:hypothetical protein [Sphaerochaeta globosa]|uniref:Uncharacterized protein n=1 Tax=Sphaerochaeta globosa (strain ATCC BAA-1886 / DSM 22777 / Buddy) TaxID=158189 RepID=F0RSX1_SPHGB|nr:hypothetical protein [Sphaerochaeta globosa]ADY14023.1 hypothetical protein SpiBuddy_2204 [Sphaerochaeta globosa str. Buddy]